MRALAVMALVALAGCADPVVSRAAAGPTRTEAGTASCDKGPGYCMTCGLTMTGKYNCSLAMRYSCPGSQPATYRVTPTLIVHESGRREIIQSSELESVSGVCQ